MMRNLFRVLLVSSALVAVSAPSAYALPGPEAAAAIAGDFAALPGLITNVSFGGLSAATALCAGNKACVLALLTAYANAGFTPTSTQLAAIASGAGVTFTDTELAGIAIASTGTTTTTTTLPGTGEQGSTNGGSGNVSTGTPGSPT